MRGGNRRRRGCFQSTLAHLHSLPSRYSVSAELEKAIAEVAAAMRVDLTPAQLEKIWQLHLACEQRIGIIIVGPSGSGEDRGGGGG